MVDEITIALIGTIVTGIGLVVAIYFNIRATQQNTKAQQYTIMKNLIDEFHKVDDLAHTCNDPYDYASKVTNFAKFMRDLIEYKIIEKDLVLPSFQSVFERSLWIFEHDEDFFMKHVKEFCTANNIKPIMTIEKIKQGFKKSH